MAVIDRHPAVKDSFVEISLTDVKARGGIADLFEDGALILIKDYRLEIDAGALAGLSKSTHLIADHGLRKQLKKLTAPAFFEGKPPRSVKNRLIFDDPLRQAIYDVLCEGRAEVFERSARTLHRAHQEALRLFDICFPGYEPYRLVPSVRLTRTMFENLHWDNHSIEDDFHQARIFANLDSRPRIWNVGHGFIDWARAHYRELDLDRFAGRDPNEMVGFIDTDVLGGTRKTWMDQEPRHRIAFEPGEVWLAESRLVSHQIYYGEAALVYMWFVKVASMADPTKRFNARVQGIHQEMATAGAD